MEVKCPRCGCFNEVEGDDLPDLACDSAEFECKICVHDFLIGWYAEVEVRDSKL